MHSGNDIRRIFLDYFEKRGHARLKSSPLVPQNDPTLMFANAGMVQFKNVFTGEENLGISTATTSQKCLRVSGKHNDFENVGRTARHHTFFEMLGNFSFGDYFKKEAIEFAWELLTVKYGLPTEKLYATVFEEDDEAHDIWLNHMGLPEDHVVRMDAKENYWSMGDTGPNGPCSEIIIDQGPDSVPGGEDADIYSDSDRFLELWNLVFMQYNTDADGVKTSLPRPSIDTGMGLERITAVLQGKFNNYDSDLFSPIIQFTSDIAEVAYGEDPEKDVSLRVVADHIRSMTFLIGDAVLPSNEGRGYVLRRIMRRAARHGVLLGLDDPFLYKVCGAVVDNMREQYPELVERRSYIAKIIRGEEDRFHRTVAKGMKMLGERIEKLSQEGSKVIDGETAFKLYDTFGFPLDLTQDIARDHKLTVDEDGFTKAMEGQRAKSAAGWKGTGAAELSEGYRELASQGLKCEFTGYDSLVADSKVAGLIVDGSLVQTAGEGQTVEIVCSTTPFYAEMGGQVGDKGKIKSESGIVTITDTQTPLPGLIVHKGKVTKGAVATGDPVKLEVEPTSRKATQANHTATHLLHHALRKTLGEDVRQAGSLVSPDRMRFDFTYFQKVDERDLADIEAEVNEAIRENLPVGTVLMDQEKAIEDGAVALFGEKYDDEVRVVSVKGVSSELCGGTHVSATGEIGLLRVISESAVGAGVRRIEALTGEGALSHLIQAEAMLAETAQYVKSAPVEVPARVEKLVADIKRLEKELAKAGDQKQAGQAGDLLSGMRQADGVNVLAAKADVADGKALRAFAVKVRDKMESGVLLMAAEIGGKVLLTCMVTDDLTKKFQAGKLIREVAPLVGGGGGGKPDLAEAGGKNPAGIEDAINKFYEIVGA